MMNRPTAIAYIDLLHALVALFVVIACVLLAQVVSTSKGNITAKAEFVAILEWPTGSSSDVDLWVRNPYGDVVSYRDKDAGLVTLDRDDLGTTNDEITGPDGGKIEALTRREMTSIRAVMPGRHVVNVMLYKLRDPPPVVATVTVIKLNPYQVVAERKVVLSTDGEERTVVSFDVAADGSVSDINTTTEISLAKVVP